MYVPVRIRDLIDSKLEDEFYTLRTNLHQTFDSLKKQAAKCIPDILRPRLDEHFATARLATDSMIHARLIETQRAIQELLSEEIEGRGEIIVVEAVDSPAHTGLLKITAVSNARGAKRHRLTRLQGEFPRSRIKCHYELGFRQRLFAEAQIFSRLRALEMDTAGSKWFATDLEFARKLLLDEKRSEDFRH
jgi:hypothetical protein